MGGNARAMPLSPLPCHSKLISVGPFSPGVLTSSPSLTLKSPPAPHRFLLELLTLLFLFRVFLMASTRFTRTPEREIKAKDKELKKVGDCTQDTFPF